MKYITASYTTNPVALRSHLSVYPYAIVELDLWYLLDTVLCLYDSVHWFAENWLAAEPKMATHSVEILHRLSLF